MYTGNTSNFPWNAFLTKSVHFEAWFRSINKQYNQNMSMICLLMSRNEDKVSRAGFWLLIQDAGPKIHLSNWVVGWQACGRTWLGCYVRQFFFLFVTFNTRFMRASVIKIAEKNIFDISIIIKHCENLHFSIYFWNLNHDSISNQN